MAFVALDASPPGLAPAAGRGSCWAVALACSAVAFGWPRRWFPPAAAGLHGRLLWAPPSRSCEVGVLPRAARLGWGGERMKLWLGAPTRRPPLAARHLLRRAPTWAPTLPATDRPRRWPWPQSGAAGRAGARASPLQRCGCQQLAHALHGLRPVAGNQDHRPRAWPRWTLAIGKVAPWSASPQGAGWTPGAGLRRATASAEASRPTPCWREVDADRGRGAAQGIGAAAAAVDHACRCGSRCTAACPRCAPLAGAQARPQQHLGAVSGRCSRPRALSSGAIRRRKTNRRATRGWSVASAPRLSASPTQRPVR